MAYSATPDDHRTVHVNLLVTKSAEIDEPSWCVDPHEGAHYRQDITHNGPEIVAEFDTPLGTIEHMRAWISQAPYGELAPEPLPLLAVEIGGDAYSLDPAQLRAYTAATRAHLDALDELADQCERIRDGGDT